MLLIVSYASSIHSCVLTQSKYTTGEPASKFTAGSNSEGVAVVSGQSRLFQ